MVCLKLVNWTQHDLSNISYKSTWAVWGDFNLPDVNYKVPYNWLVPHNRRVLLIGDYSIKDNYCIIAEFPYNKWSPYNRKLPYNRWISIE